jgi:hypothetical protein
MPRERFKTVPFHIDSAPLPFLASSFSDLLIRSGILRRYLADFIRIQKINEKRLGLYL